MNNIVESIPAHWYHDENIFEREQRTIFAKQWVFVSPASDLVANGDYVTAQIAGRSIVVVVGEDGELAGFYNLCRHRAAALCPKSHGNLSMFVCPYHSWSYGLDGALKGAPGFNLSVKEALEQNDDSLGLIKVKVSSWNGLVFACLDEDSISLEDWLGDIRGIADRFPSVESMEVERLLENEGMINWKNYSDNSAKGYHLSSVHRRLNQSLVRNQTRIDVYENGQFVGFDVTYHSEESDEKGSPGFWIYKYPGLLLHFSTHSFNIEKVTPISARKTRMQRWFWFDKAINRNERKETIEFSNEVMDEDVGICLNVQQNLEGGVYHTGYLSSEREPGTIFFQRCIKTDCATLRL